MFISLWPLITKWASVQGKVRSNPQLTHDVIMIASVQGKCPCVRALVIHSIYGQKTCLYKIHCSSSEWIDTPNSFSYLDRLWVGDMISCLIWHSINSWRHHNGLRTQNFNLHIMTSAYFWKIDCISVNIDQFSSKFWYVLAETNLYK